MAADMNRRHLTAAIVALAGLATTLPVGADALIDNVNGLTLNRDRQVVRFKAMVIDPQGKVVRLVAPDEQPPKPTKKNPGPRYDWRADMKGRVLVPGMIDAHGHVIELGLAALTLDLSDTRSLDEAKAKIVSGEITVPETPQAP